MTDFSDDYKIALELCLRIVAKCAQSRGTAARVAACQESECALHVCGPALALIDLSAGSDGHADSR